MTGPLAELMSGPISADPPRTSGSRERPTVTMQLASLNAAYADLKLLFDWIGDAKNQQILQEMLDMSFEGVDPRRPCEILGIAHPRELEFVA